MFFSNLKKQFKKTKSKKVSFKVSSINFINEKLVIEILVAGIEHMIISHSKLVIKDMTDSENYYSFNFKNSEDKQKVTCEVDLSDMPFLKKEGKWSLYIKNERNEFRLSPTDALINSIPNTRNLIHDELYTEPYLTVKNNISIRTFRNPKKKPFVESHITQIDLDTGNLQISGIINQNRLNMTDVKLCLQKRNTDLKHEFPLQWIENDKWTAEIDLNCNDFPKGTWDYYICYDQDEKSRIKITQNLNSDETAIAFYNQENETVRITYYKTIKGSFSTKHNSAVITILDMVGLISNTSKVKLSGSIKNKIFESKYLENPMFILKEGNSESKYETVANLNRGNSSDSLNFETVINYNSITIAEKAKLDAYLQFTAKGTDYLFRIRVNSDSLPNSTRVQYDDPKALQIYLYPTVNSNLSLALSHPKIQRDIINYKFKDGLILLEGYAFFEIANFKEDSLIERTIVIRKRNSNQEITVPISGSEAINLKDNYYDYSYPWFDAEIPLKDIYSMQNSLKEVYDLYIRLTYKSYTSERKLGCEEFTFLVDAPLDKGIVKHNDYTYLNYLLFTPGGNIKLESYCYTDEKADYITHNKTADGKNTNKDVWLIGERPDTAQDTGYHFFKYCRENYPQQEVYYVIEEDSPDMKNVKDLGNVLIFGSIEHLKMTAITKKFIGSHDLEYILPSRGIDWPSYREGQRVFLQHGVLGRKNVDYYKKYYKFPFHMFCVSSAAEYELVITEMGYEKNEVKITGLSRFDELISEHVEEKLIAIIPTWRDWIKTESEFLESSYYNNYKKLITDSTLLKSLEESNTKVQFFLHYRMQPYIQHFKEIESTHVEVIEIGKTNIQDIIKNSKLLITDYSSISFDFNYMGKPIIFYHFDYNQFFKNGILRPKEETFLGDMYRTHDKVIEAVKVYIQNNFQEKQYLTDRINENFAYIDQNNNERIFEAVKNLS